MNRGLSVQGIRLLVLIGIAAGGARVVSSFYGDVANHNAAGLNLDITLSIATVGAVFLVCALIALALFPGQRRYKILTVEYPASVVIPARFNPEFSEYVLANYLPGRRLPNQIRGVTFTVVTKSDGIQIWIGVRMPRMIAILSWQNIESVELGSKSTSPIRTDYTIDIRLKGRADLLQFVVGSARFAGAFPAGEEATRKFVDELQELLRDPSDSAV